MAPPEALGVAATVELVPKLTALGVGLTKGSVGCAGHRGVELSEDGGKGVAFLAECQRERIDRHLRDGRRAYDTSRTSKLGIDACELGGRLVAVRGGFAAVRPQLGLCR